MKNQKVHAGLLVLIGGYFFFIAYHLYENLRAGSADMSTAGFIAAIAGFCLAALGAFVYAFIVWRRESKKDGEQK